MDREQSAAELIDLAERVRNGSVGAFVALETTIKDATVQGVQVSYFYADSQAYKALLDRVAGLSQWAERELNAKGAA